MNLSAARFFSRIVEIQLPDLGEGTKEATVKEWYVKPGAMVTEFDDLVEVFTDKLVAKIPSTCDGVVQSLDVEVDDVCLVGHSLLRIQVADGASMPEPEPAQESTTAAETPVEQATAEAATDTRQPQSGPAVRHYAKSNGIDLNTIHGTGKNGRVTKGDVLAVIDGTNNTQPAQEQTQQHAPSTNIHVPVSAPTAEDKVKKIVGIQKAMTKTMTASLSVPTFTFSDDCDATKLLALRQTLKNQIEGGITILPFFIKALSLAMEEFPAINSVVSPELDADGFIKEYIIKASHNFSVAIDSKDGLVTPNLKNINTKSIKQINTDLKDLVHRVNNGTLARADYDDGTFSVSSVGNIGGRYFVPTILRPNVGIIAIGKAKKVPNYTGNGTEHAWEPIDSVSYSITADHRVIDGATVARFSQRFKSYIEDPNLMLISS